VLLSGSWMRYRTGNEANQNFIFTPSLPLSMCLAVPAKVVSISEDRQTARVDFGGVEREVNVSLVEVGIGKYVIVHAGFAIQTMDEEEAQETLDIWREYTEIVGDADPYAGEGFPGDPPAGTDTGS